MKFLNHNLFTGDITVNGTTTLSTATGITRATGDNSTHLATTEFVKAQGYATTAALSGYVPITRTITINGTTLDLSANRAWTITTAGTVRTIYETVKNASGATILKGTPLSVMPGQTSGNVSDVRPADASDPTKMPAVFIANENIADEAEGEAVLFGNLTGVNTAAYTPGTTVYVAPGGGWTATKPVWPNKVQNLGVITKQHATNGAGIVTGVGRANDLPNLTAGKIWVGSANYPIESTTVHVDEANGRVGVGTASPTAPLEITNTGSAGGGYTMFNASYSAAKQWGMRKYGIDNGTGIAFFSDVQFSSTWWNATRIGHGQNANNPSLQSYYTTYLATTAGNVGIGTTSPAYKLDVAGAVRFSNELYVSGVWSTSYGPRNSGEPIKFVNWSATELVRINTTDGNVGIGTTSPVSALSVVGKTNLGNQASGFYVTPSTLHIASSTVSQISFEDYVVTAAIAIANNTFAFGHQNASPSYEFKHSNTYNGNYATTGTTFARFNPTTSYISIGNVGIGTTNPSNKLQVANGDMSITTGYSFILADTDTNWRLGRNIIVENGNQLTANTMQFVAANTANEGWQFVDDDGNTRFEIGASTGNAWLPSGNLYLNGNLAATQAWVGAQGYLTSVSDVWVNTTGDTMTGALTIQGGWASTILDGDNVVLRKPNYSSGGWARTLLNFQEYDTTSLFQIGGYGNNNTMTYGYLGSAYNTPTIKWYANKNVAFSGNIIIDDAADNNRYQKGGSFLNLRDPWNNIHFSNNGGGIYVDSPIHYWRSASGSTYWMTLDGGNVGIGTISPAAKLHVAGSVLVTGDRIDVNSNTRITGAYYQNSGTEYTYLQMYNGGDASINIGTKHPLSYISFESGNGAYTERMRITNTGNVGINTTAPTAKLHVEGPSGDGTPVFRVNGTTAPNSFNYAGSLMNSDLGSSRNTILLIGKAQSNRDSGYIGFNHSGTNGSNSNFLTFGLFQNDNIMNITGAGNVGIGTTSPGTKLDVNGVITATGGNSTNWNTAYGWGNHASAGYLTSYTETDTLATVVSRGNSTLSAIRVKRPSNKVDNSGATEFGGRIEFNNDFVAGESGYMVFRYPTYNNFLIGGDYDGNIGGAIPNIQFGRANGSVYMHIAAQSGTGNVGIGTTSPSYKLDISGNSRTTGIHYVDTYLVTPLIYGGGPITMGNDVFISSTEDGKLTLRVPSGDSSEWNYINFTGSNGVRDAYLGTDGGGTPTWWRDDNGVNITLGSSVLINGNTAWHAGNDGSGSGLDADLLDGYQSSTLSTANTIALRDSVGDISAREFVLTASTIHTTTPSSIVGIFPTTNQVVKFADTAVRTFLNVPTRTGGDASGTWGISISGNADTATNLIGLGSIQSTSTGTSYQNNYQVRENSGGGSNTNEIYAPQLAFHWSGVVASSIMMEASGRMAIRNNPGGSYENFIAAVVYSSGYGDSTQWNTAYGWGNHASQGYATQTYVNTAISNLVDAAPAALDTLNELAAALGDDPNFATTVATSIGNKVAKAGDTMTGNLNWGATNLGLTWDMNTDGAYIKFFNTSNGDTDSRLEYGTYDDGNEYHRWVISSVERMNLKAAGLTVTGNVTCTGTFTETSSRRFKENIVDLEPTAEKVEKLRPVRYNKVNNDATEIGLIAEEVAELFPEVVTYNEDGQPSGVQYQRLSVILLKTVQEQNVALAALTERINKLENK